MNKLRFIISRYIDGTYKIETKHMHYAFRDDLNYDDVFVADVPQLMYKITSILVKEDLQAVFVII